MITRSATVEGIGDSLKVTVTTVDEMVVFSMRELPTRPRQLRQMSTICMVCGEEIETDTFIGGFVSGRANPMFHPDCIPGWENY